MVDRKEKAQGNKRQDAVGSVVTLNLPREVLVLTTGGTIEKTYNEADGSLENRESILQQQIVPMLRLPYTKLIIKTLMCKDSLLMTDSDREEIAEAIITYMPLGHPIVVIHGTDTMEHSARFCALYINKLDVPVVFTGAMKPVGFQDSDAIQNVTEALMVAKVIAPGVYISFHNHLFKAGQVRKNRQAHTFEECIAQETGSTNIATIVEPKPR